jgi:hypothetical protein
MDRGNTALQQMDEGTGRIFEEEKRKMMPYFSPPNIQKKYAQKSRVTHVAAHIWLKCLKKTITTLSCNGLESNHFSAAEQ